MIAPRNAQAGPIEKVGYPRFLCRLFNLKNRFDTALGGINGEVSHSYTIAASVNSCQGDIAAPYGVVDAADLAVFAGNFGNTGCSGDDCRGDFDDPADNDIDAADLVVMIDEIGRTDCL